MKLKFDNRTLLEDAEKTNVSSTIFASGTTLVLYDTSGLTANDYIAIGKFGNERTEIVQISSVDSATQVTLDSGVSFDHNVDESVYKIDYNQVRFSRSTTTDGAKTTLATVDISADNEFTIYNDTSNTTGFGWAVPYNSTTTTARSTFDGPQTYGGYSTKSLYSLKNKVYSQITDKERMFIDEEDVVNWLNEAYDIAVTSLLTTNKEYYSTTATLSFTADNEFADLPADLYELIKIFNDTGGTRYIWDEVQPYSDVNNDLVGNIDSDTVNPESIHYFAIIGDQVQIFPTPNTSFSATAHYISKPSLIERKADGDEFDIPGVNPFFLTYYACHMAKMKAENMAASREYERKWNDAVLRLTLFQHRRTSSSDGFNIDRAQLV